MPRVYIEKITVKDGVLRLTGEDAHYLTNVLRQRKGDSVEVFDSLGRFFDGRVIDAATREVLLNITPRDRQKEEHSTAIVLCQGLLKGAKMDMVIQKTTELGVSEIITFYSSRCQYKETGKLSRWNKIAVEASRQSGRVAVPVVSAPISYSDLLLTIKCSKQSRAFIFYEKTGVSLKSVALCVDVKTIYAVTGPEGGFSSDEIDEAEAADITPVFLGNRILRAETAAVASVLLLQFLFGDIE
ncbi:MAG: 16S rRNA (uracil(1498)-N(3))-methyltransferase [Nitrospirae bacterium YQR-1]